MRTRLELHEVLVNIFGSKNVYFQPPASVKMEYPAIRYSKTNIVGARASDKLYTKHDKYEIIVIDKKIDNPVIAKLLEIPYCSYDRHYVSDNLNHDVFTLYL